MPTALSFSAADKTSLARYFADHGKAIADESGA